MALCTSFEPSSSHTKCSIHACICTYIHLYTYSGHQTQRYIAHKANTLRTWSKHVAMHTALYLTGTVCACGHMQHVHVYVRKVWFCITAHHYGVIATLSDISDLLRQHSQFLKVDETVHLSLIAVKEESEVFLDDGEEGDEGRVSGSLELTVLGHVVERIHVAHQVLCVCVFVCMYVHVCHI